MFDREEIDRLDCLNSYNFDHMDFNKMTPILNIMRASLDLKNVSFVVLTNNIDIKAVCGEVIEEIQDKELYEDLRNIDSLSFLREGGEENICAIPLYSSSEYKLGALILSKKNNKIEDREKRLIKVFAKEIMNIVEAEKENFRKRDNLVSLGKMIGSVVHEINNPLSVIQGNAMIMKKKIDEKEFILEKIEVISEMSKRISYIIKNSLTNIHEKEIQVINLKEFYEEFYSMYKQTFKDVPVEGELEDVEVMCNRYDLEQIFLNLIKNAIYEIKDNENPKIKISSCVIGKHALVSVRDNGEIINEDIQDKLFTPLFTTKKQGQGTGFGLSVSKELMNKMDGDVFYNEIGGQNSFNIKIKTV